MSEKKNTLFWYEAEPNVDRPCEYAVALNSLQFGDFLFFFSTFTLGHFFENCPCPVYAVLSLVPGLTKRLAPGSGRKHAATEGGIQNLAGLLHLSS